MRPQLQVIKHLIAMLSANEISGSSAKSNSELNETPGRGRCKESKWTHKAVAVDRCFSHQALSIVVTLLQSRTKYSNEAASNGGLPDIWFWEASSKRCNNCEYCNYHILASATSSFIHLHTHTHNARPAPLLTRDAGNVRSLVTKQEMSRLTGHAPPMHVLHKAQVMPVKKHVCDWVFQFVHWCLSSTIYSTFLEVDNM
jgi:hypothetical protein